MEYNAYQNIYNGEPLTKRRGAEFIHRLREALMVQYVDLCVTISAAVPAKDVGATRTRVCYAGLPAKLKE